MKPVKHRTECGFSLLEVVIVVAILAVLAAIAIPRMPWTGNPVFSVEGSIFYALIG